MVRGDSFRPYCARRSFCYTWNIRFHIPALLLQTHQFILLVNSRRERIDITLGSGGAEGIHTHAWLAYSSSARAFMIF